MAADRRELSREEMGPYLETPQEVLAEYLEEVSTCLFRERLRDGVQD